MAKSPLARHEPTCRILLLAAVAVPVSITVAIVPAARTPASFLIILAPFRLGLNLFDACRILPVVLRCLSRFYLSVGHRAGPQSGWRKACCGLPPTDAGLLAGADAESANSGGICCQASVAMTQAPGSCSGPSTIRPRPRPSDRKPAYDADPDDPIENLHVLPKECGRLVLTRGSARPSSAQARPARRLRRAAPTGQRPLPVPGHRVRQHRQRLVRDRRLAVPLIRRTIPAGITMPSRRGLAAGGDPAERAADAERRHPGEAGDLAQSLARRVQLADPRDDLRRHLRRALRPAAARTSPATPPDDSAWSHRQIVAGSTPNAPATCSCDAARSRTSCTAASRRPASSPASQAKVASPSTTTSPPSSPSEQAHSRGGDLGRPGRQQRERKLAKHTSHHPPHPPAVILAAIFSQLGHMRRERHAVNADQPATITWTPGPMSGVLVPSARCL